jgi:hypothetical protein
MLFGEQIAGILNSQPLNAFTAKRGRWVLLLSDRNSSVSRKESVESTPKPRGPRKKLAIDPEKPGQAIGLAHREKVVAGPQQVSPQAAEVLKRRKRG